MGTIDRAALENSLGSPLRLRLVAELLESPGGLTLDSAVVLSGRPSADVEAVLRPMLGWGVLELVGDRYRLSPDLPADREQTIRAVLERRRAAVELEREVRSQELCGMIGVDQKMLMVFQTITQLARLDIPVLITGETGTGKEMVARAIHKLSARRDGLFGPVNCGTLTDELFATEVLGHVKGAFTGAIRDHVGLFERAHGGTLFLDEVGELPAYNQVKLLRMLQEGTFRRVGDERVRQSDARVISATNRDMEGAVASGEFREDLYYRLNVFPLRLPSLRERPADLPFLARDMLATRLAHLRTDRAVAPISDAAIEVLQGHDWPGNVRELENVLMRALVTSGGRTIEPESLPPLRRRTRDLATDSEARVMRSLAEVEDEHVRLVMAHVDGNVSAAARILGISRSTLYGKLR